MTQIEQMTTHDHISLHQFPYFIYSTRQTREGTMLRIWSQLVCIALSLLFDKRAQTINVYVSIVSYLSPCAVHCYSHNQQCHGPPNFTGISNFLVTAQLHSGQDICLAIFILCQMLNRCFFPNGDKASVCAWDQHSAQAVVCCCVVCQKSTRVTVSKLFILL